MMFEFTPFKSGSSNSNISKSTRTRSTSIFSAFVFASLSLSNALLVMSLPLHNQGNGRTNAVKGKIASRRQSIDFSGGSGEGTFYQTGKGACGGTNSPSEHVAAVAFTFFDAYAARDGPDSEGVNNPNKNPICGKKIRVRYKGKSTTVTVVDRCAGCNGTYDLDFSTSAFDDLADQSVGRIYGMKWRFVDATGGGDDDDSDEGDGAGGDASGAGGSGASSGPGDGSQTGTGSGGSNEHGQGQDKESTSSSASSSSSTTSGTDSASSSSASPFSNSPPSSTVSINSPLPHTDGNNNSSSSNGGRSSVPRLRVDSKMLISLSFHDLSSFLVMVTVVMGASFVFY
ncbi:hypothetical protein D9758_014936 [Tetrapyrgos nigripes]|uniref:RlpA-like protein double-psi beta-barrel domain-containing protein n=1 Tax=Tetrapyrgos nigripes TaxID=182062 RepID=A0A8H5C9I0_9AGAR|nr:hypothetical protein D9758_014936 [Tetrapyrgos nigripes]